MQRLETFYVVVEAAHLALVLEAQLPVVVALLALSSMLLVLMQETL